MADSMLSVPVYTKQRMAEAHSLSVRENCDIFQAIIWLFFSFFSLLDIRLLKKFI